MVKNHSFVLDRKDISTSKRRELRATIVNSIGEGDMAMPELLGQIEESGKVAVPTYMVVKARGRSSRDNTYLWRKSIDTRAERARIYDADGIIGPVGNFYAMDIQNGGFFVGDAERMGLKIEQVELSTRGQFQLDQLEVNRVLEAYAASDYKELNKWLFGQNFTFAGGYDDFLEVSKNPGFISNGNETYVVVRPIEQEEASPHNVELDTTELYDHPDLIIWSGGKKPLANMLDKYQEFGHENITSPKLFEGNNISNVITVGDRDGGIHACDELDLGGQFAVVKPELRDKFYQANIAQLVK